MLLQLLRGAGPDGLAGMAVRSGRLLRPLLAARRAETRACCVALGLAWREDPTNADDGPLRNRVRQRLLPLLEELRPGTTQTLARTAALAADERDWLDPLVAEALAATLTGVWTAEYPDSPWATLPDGAPQPVGVAHGGTRPGVGVAHGWMMGRRQPGVGVAHGRTRPVEVLLGLTRRSWRRFRSPWPGGSSGRRPGRPASPSPTPPPPTGFWPSRRIDGA